MNLHPIGIDPVRAASRLTGFNQRIKIVVTSSAQRGPAPPVLSIQPSLLWGSTGERSTAQPPA